MIKPQLQGMMPMVLMQVPFGKGEALAPACSKALDRFDMSGVQKICEFAFDFLDADGSGTLEKKELKLIFDDVSDSMEQGDPSLLIELFFRRIVDKNKDGKLGVEEVQDLVKKVLKIVVCFVTAFIGCFDDMVCSSEVQQVMSELMVQGGRFSDLDTDGDGCISRA